MQHLGKFLSLTALIVCICCSPVLAQTTDSTTSVDADLENIFKGSTPKEYRVGTVVVTGNKYFDQALLLSIANLTTGEKAMIPGTDIFSKAIGNLWAQNYFSNVVIYITRLEQPNIIHLEINVQERPRLGKFFFKNVKKAMAKILQAKQGWLQAVLLPKA